MNIEQKTLMEQYGLYYGNGSTGTAGMGQQDMWFYNKDGQWASTSNANDFDPGKSAISIGGWWLRPLYNDDLSGWDSDRSALMTAWIGAYQLGGVLNNLDFEYFYPSTNAIGADSTIEKLVQGRMNLQYSTFGYYSQESYNPYDFLNSYKLDSVDPFAGGKEEFRLSFDEVAGAIAASGQESATFSGVTGGVVEITDSGVFVGVNGLADLTFNADKSQKLDMWFANWYDVTISKEFGEDAYAVVKSNAGLWVADPLKISMTNGQAVAAADLNTKFYGTGAHDAEAVGTYDVVGEEFTLRGAFGAHYNAFGQAGDLDGLSPDQMGKLEDILNMFK
jgi:hypothetical protein